MMKSKLIVNKAHRVAKLGEPHVPQVSFRKGEFPVGKYPEWAVAHMVDKGHAKIIESKEEKKPDPTPEEIAALEKAKAEEEAAKKKAGK